MQEEGLQNSLQSTIFLCNTPSFLLERNHRQWCFGLLNFITKMWKSYAYCSLNTCLHFATGFKSFRAFFLSQSGFSATFSMTFSMSRYCNYIRKKDSELTRDARSEPDALSTAQFASAKSLHNTKFTEIKVNN